MNIGFTTFRYTKENIDEIFQLLLLNKNSISCAFECYSQKITPEHDYYNVVRLIEQCADSIRDGVKTSDEYWAKNIERVKKLGHYFRKVEL